MTSPMHLQFASERCARYAARAGTQILTIGTRKIAMRLLICHQAISPVVAFLVTMLATVSVASCQEDPPKDAEPSAAVKEARAHMSQFKVHLRARGEQTTLEIR